MSLTSPGVQLKKEDKKKRNFDRCILCQKVKDTKGDKKLTSTQNGRTLLLEASTILKDSLVTEIPDDEKQNVKYHVNTCYSRQETK